jgi:hypothetical protein
MSLTLATSSYEQGGTIAQAVEKVRAIEVSLDCSRRGQQNTRIVPRQTRAAGSGGAHAKQ